MKFRVNVNEFLRERNLEITPEDSVLEDTSKLQLPPGKDTINIADRELGFTQDIDDIKIVPDKTKRKKKSQLTQMSSELSVPLESIPLDKRAEELAKRVRKISREKLRAVTDGAPGSAESLGEMQIYLALASNKRILSTLMSAARKKGPDEYQRVVDNLAQEIESSKWWKAVIGIGSVAALETIDILGTGGLLGSIMIGAAAGTGDVALDKLGVISAVGQWNRENFKQFAIAIYPILKIAPRNFRSKNLRAVVDDLVDGNLRGEYSYDPPSWFPTTGYTAGGYEKVTDAQEVYKAIQGFGTWEKDIKQVLSRRSKSPGDLVNLYDEFNEYIGKTGKASGFEKNKGLVTDVILGRGKVPGFKNRVKFQRWMKANSIDLKDYHDDLIDWLWLDGMYKEAIDIMKALAQSTKTRNSPPYKAQSAVESVEEEKAKEYKGTYL
jgi:hypothetical protein